VPGSRGVEVNHRSIGPPETEIGQVNNLDRQRPQQEFIY